MEGPRPASLHFRRLPRASDQRERFQSLHNQRALHQFVRARRPRHTRHGPCSSPLTPARPARTRTPTPPSPPPPAASPPPNRPPPPVPLPPPRPHSLVGGPLRSLLPPHPFPSSR